MNGMQWPQSPVLPPFPPQIQSNTWNQQSLQPVATMLNGMSNPIQQVSQLSSNLGLLPANILQDVFRLSVPVGASTNDETLLVQVLKGSVEKGQTYKQALETLHGVS